MIEVSEVEDGRRKLLKLAAFLRDEVATLPPGRFNMARFATEADLRTDPECGTAACAFGWATVVWPQELWLEVAPNIWPLGEFLDVMLEGSTARNFGAAGEFFRLGWREVDALFGTVRQDGGESITAGQEAERIEIFVREGLQALEDHDEECGYED